MDKFKAMQTAVTIADTGSLTAAATVLVSSPPTVVRTLAALEAHLGIRVFNRSTRRISLTEEGRHYIESCRQLLEAVKNTETELLTHALEPVGHIVVTAPVLFGQMFIAPAVTRFVQKYAKVSVHLVLLDRVVNLLEENMDVGIRIGALEDSSSLVAQFLCSVRRMTVASPAYFARHPIPRHPRDLYHANCIRFSEGTGALWSFYEDGKKFNVPVSGNLEFNQIAPIADACKAGLGFGMFISYQIAHALEKNQLQSVLESYEPPPRPINIVYPHAKLLPARTRLFIEWIKQELKDLSAMKHKDEISR